MIETVFILVLSLFLSLVYTAASPSGINLLKKAFRIQVAAGAGDAETDRLRTSEAAGK